MDKNAGGDTVNRIWLMMWKISCDLITRYCLYNCLVSYRRIFCVLYENEKKISPFIKCSIIYQKFWQLFLTCTKKWWSIDAAMRHKKKHKEFYLQYRKCAQVCRSNYKSERPRVVAEGFERRFANNIVYLRSLSLSIRVGLHAWP